MQTKLKRVGESLLVAGLAIIMFLLGIVMSGVGIDIIKIMFNY